MTVQYSVGKTNCLTEVPNNVKLRLDAGTLTLEKGSKVYFPNGFEEDGTTAKFDEVVIENDLDIICGTTTATQRFCWVISPNGTGNGSTQYFYSGDTSTMNSITPYNYSTFYNTETNKMYRGDGSSWGERQYSLPVCMATNDVNEKWTTVEQIFDWCGYMGSTIFVLPGVKSLVSDGWNEDGTYKNLIGITNNVIIRSNPNAGAKNICLYYDENGNASSIGFGIYDDTISTLSERESSWTSGHYVYVKDENKRYVNLNTTPSHLVVVTDMIVDSSTSKITSITPYETKTTNDLKNIGIKYGVGKTNCLTSVPQNIDLELDSLNVTVVGSPTFNNGVVSGFSTSNYLKIDKTFSGSQKWEVLLKFNTSGTFNGNKVLFDVSNNSSPRAITMYITSAMKMKIGLSSSTSASDIRGEAETNYTFVANKDYQYKLSFDGSVYKGEVYDYDTESWIEDLLLENSTPVYTSNLIMIGCWQGLSSSTEYAGSIDIANSYIKVNDEIWWKGGTGSLTLKAGSKVYVPNGSGVFDAIDIKSNILITLSSDRQSFLYYYNGGLYFADAVEKCVSGDTDTLAGQQWHVWYDTTNNIIKRYTGDATTPTHTGMSLPLAVITASNGAISSIDQVFNGFGYIGSTVFALPGVKGLIPDGFNANETYKSIEFETDRVLTYGRDLSQTDVPLWIRPDFSMVFSKGIEHNKDINHIVVSSTGELNVDAAAILSADLSSGKITSFTPYEVKTTNDTIDIKEVHQCVGKTNCLTELPNDINLELDPLNVTVVGTPTNSNGVVSNFSTANYLLTDTINFNTAYNWEIVIKAKHNSETVNRGFVATKTRYSGLNAYHNQANVLGFELSSNGTSFDIGQITGKTVLPAQEWFYAKYEFTGSKYNFYYSNDGIEWNLEGSIESTLHIKANTQFVLGNDDQISTPVAGLNIDIPSCYIKVNDEFVWQGGTGTLTLKEGSKVYVPNGFEEENYYKHNVSKIGSPTLTNGIANNFSVGNLLTLNDSFNVEDKNWEVGVKITTGSSISGGQTIWGSIPDYNGFLLRANNGTVILWLSTNGTSWNGLSSVASTLVLQPNTTYYIKLSFNGTQYLIDASNDGVNYNNYLTHSSNVLMVENHSTIGGHGVTTSLYDTPFLGSIDLTQSYIKINDEIIWQGIIEGTKTDNDYVVYSGNKKFDEVVIESDLIRESSKDTAGDYLIFYYPEENKVSSIKIEETSSGSSYPTTTTEKSWVYYNTTENKILYTGTSGTDWTRQYGFPVAIVEADVLSFIKIKQIFNGIGYIGSHYFMTDGIKCLEPDGWNEDGTYKVNERQSTNVYVSAEQTGDVANRAICLTYNNGKLLPEWKDNYQTIQSKDLILAGDIYYLIDENKIYSRYRGLYLTTTKVGSYQVTSGKITNFKVDNIKTTNDTKIMY